MITAPMALVILSSLLIKSCLIIVSVAAHETGPLVSGQWANQTTHVDRTELNLEHFFFWHEPGAQLNYELLTATPFGRNLVRESEIADYPTSDPPDGDQFPTSDPTSSDDVRPSTDFSTSGYRFVSSSNDAFKQFTSVLSTLSSTSVLAENLTTSILGSSEITANRSGHLAGSSDQANLTTNRTTNLTANLAANQTANQTAEFIDDDEGGVNTLYDVPVHLIVLLALAYGLVSLTAVVGNSIVLWFVVRSRKLRTVTNIFIANLAIADILIGALAIPFQFQAALLQRWVLPHIMCSFCSFIQIVSVNVSVGTLSAIAADRYLVVFYPIKYRIKKRSAKFIIVFIWFFSVLAAVPALIALRVVYIPDLMNVTINQELSSALLIKLASMNVNSTSDLLKLQHTLNTTSNSNLDALLRSSSPSNGQPDPPPDDEWSTRPSNTIFWLDDLLAKIDLMQNRDEHLGTLLGNITLPLKPHCGNTNLSAYHWRTYNLFLVLIQYFIPLIVITFAYTKMGLKLRETDKRLNKRSSSKLQRINTTSSGGGFSSSSVRTTNNNLIVSPGTANCNVQMAIELQQTGGQPNPMGAVNKRCRSLDCSPLEEGACLMAHDARKCSQSTTPTGRYSPQCFNCAQQHTHVTQMNSTNVSIHSKHRTSCTECCKEAQMMNAAAHNAAIQNAAAHNVAAHNVAAHNAAIQNATGHNAVAHNTAIQNASANNTTAQNATANNTAVHNTGNQNMVQNTTQNAAIVANNNNDCMLNKNVAGRSNSCNASMKKGSCKCNACKCRRYEAADGQQPGGQFDHHNSLHRHHQSSQQSPQQPPPLQHHSSLQPTGSIHSNLMMPMISHPITALRVNPHAEYIVINKKKVIKMLFIVCSLFAFLWLPIQTYNLLKDFFFEINGYRYINVIWFVMHFMAMASASTNPFVYAIYSLRN